MGKLSEKIGRKTIGATVLLSQPVAVFRMPIISRYSFFSEIYKKKNRRDGKMKLFRGLKLASKINLLVLGMIVSIAVVMALVVEQQVENGAKGAAVEKVKSDLQLAYNYIDLKYPGEWSIKDDMLYKGDLKINDYFELVDEIGELTGGTVTVFQGDTRVATNVILEDGKRAIGTKVSQEVVNKVLKEGKRFYGEANVVGHTYQTGYQPMKNANGDIVGIWYVGASEAFISEMISSTMQKFFIVLAIAIIIAFLLVILFSRRLKNRLDKVTKALEEAGKGNFSITLEDKVNDEIGQLITSYNQMKDNINALIQDVMTTSEQVAASSEQMTASAEQTAKATEQISEAIQEVASGSDTQVASADHASKVVLEISGGMDQIVQNIQSVNDSSRETSETAKQGNEVILKAIEQMNQISGKTKAIEEVIQILGTKSGEIGKIISIITDIAEQTNLLALNAAIEAARAGEHGKGFAVVADEVRKLAEQSGQAAGQINQLITEIQKETNKAVDAMDDGSQAVNQGITMVNDAGGAFEGITKSVEQVSIQIDGISAAGQQINTGIERLVLSIKKVMIVSEESAGYTQNVAASAEEQNASMEEIASAANTLAKMAEEMQQAVNRFKL